MYHELQHIEDVYQDAYKPHLSLFWVIAQRYDQALSKDLTDILICLDPTHELETASKYICTL